MSFGDVFGSRKKANVVVVNERNGQFRVTIPRSLALAFGLSSGSLVSWEFTQRGLLMKRGGSGGGF